VIVRANCDQEIGSECDRPHNTALQTGERRAMVFRKTRALAFAPLAAERQNR